MSTFAIDLKWKRETEFIYDKFNRSHTLLFPQSRQTLDASSAPEYLGNEDMTNPEEILASAVSSCHMLTFLAVASKSGYIVDSYEDHAEAILDKNEEGKPAITEVNLHPVIQFSGDKLPTAEQLKSLHDKAHRNCFIANSIKAKVSIS